MEIRFVFKDSHFKPVTLKDGNDMPAEAAATAAGVAAN